MKSQTKKMALHHTATSSSVADKTSLKVLPKNICPPKSLWKLNDDVLKKQAYELMSVDDYAPSDRKKRYKFIQDLNQGLVKQCVLCTYSIGGPMGNYHFLWQLPDKVSMEAAL